ncbi:MAG: cytochrome c [Acidobacteria bacterium]|nr:cytochrome c [Acidobacteriota bacterium]
MKLNRPFLFLGCVVAFLPISASAADQKTQDLYKSKCQGCHGADGKGTTMGKKLGAKDFQDPGVAQASKADWVKITSEGKGKMPAYKGKLADEQISGLVSYIKEMK